MHYLKVTSILKIYTNEWVNLFNGFYFIRLRLFASEKQLG